MRPASAPALNKWAGVWGAPVPPAAGLASTCLGFSGGESPWRRFRSRAAGVSRKQWRTCALFTDVPSALGDECREASRLGRAALRGKQSVPGGTSSVRRKQLAQLVGLVGLRKNGFNCYLLLNMLPVGRVLASVSLARFSWTRRCRFPTVQPCGPRPRPAPHPVGWRGFP